MNKNCLSKLWIGLMIALLLPVAIFAETYAYDAAGRLTSTTYADGSSITYAYDANGNILNKTSSNGVVDTTPPVITLLGVSPITIAVGSAYSDAGATALDNVDGNITANIATVNPVNPAVVGTYTVTYDVSDAAGNAATQVTRTVNVTDQTAPVITRLGASPITIAQGSVYADAGATALDNVDGNITANIATVNPVSTAVVGTYTVTYNVSDAAGNAATQVTRTVNVTDQTSPVITRLGTSPLTVAFGSVYTDAGATALDNVDGNITANIITVNPVNINAIGTYTVTYNVSDAAGNAATQMTRTVNVADQTAPVITLNGITPITIAQGAIYNDAGATALDNVDGAVAAVKTGTVNAAAAGVYILTYTATDAAGNSSTATRRVNVTAPGTTNGGTTAKVLLAGTGGTVDIVSANEILSNFSAASTAGTTPPAGVSFPFGTVSYATTVTPGGSQTVNLTFSTALPANTVLYKVNAAGAYTLIPNGTGVDQWTQVNATTVALTFTDGGPFDLDGSATNGVIVDPVAVGNGGTSAPFIASSGGCTIANNSNASVDPSLPVLALLSMFWLAIKRKRGDHRP